MAAISCPSTTFCLSDGDLGTVVIGVGQAHHGYRLAAADGGVFAYGTTFYGSAASLHLAKPIVGITSTPDGAGYWLVGADGGVYAFGDAPYDGSLGGTTLNRPVVGMAAGPTGYWLVAADGGIFAYGGTGFFGSAAALLLNAPVVGMATTGDGGGYWLAASDGGVFAYGDAGFSGSAGSIHLAAPVVGLSTGS
jgi:hypothetical protein